MAGDSPGHLFFVTNFSRNEVAFGEEVHFFGDLSRNGAGFGEEMHFFGGAGRVCPGFGLVSGRKCISSGICPGFGLLSGRKCISLVGLEEFVPDLGEFWGGNAFLLGGKDGLSRNEVAFGEEMHFFGGAGRVCPGFG